MDKQASANASLALDYLKVAARAVWSVSWSRHLASLAHFCALPLRFVWLPLSYFYSLLLVLVAPGLYIIAFSFAWARAIAGFLSALEPLFTFLGAAAAVGTVSGIALAFASSFITNMLGMHQDTHAPRRIAKGVPRDSNIEQTLLPASPTDADWYWTESSGKHGRPRGLLSQTILEEDDSDI
ncbi:hypothetical protein CDD81_7364 [Ophiocordyceps australis]|uniref:Uncharacterized protein n=1 Tax=Ophiocordyceps australis TaxID=1399860 RepID=A0A2C5Y424_9HYPO|nr:hypothetical protein CDD81_7364 [Ophiocordyceps australis]